jgi:hypothetical protein
VCISTSFCSLLARASRTGEVMLDARCEHAIEDEHGKPAGFGSMHEKLIVIALPGLDDPEIVPPSDRERIREILKIPLRTKILETKFMPRSQRAARKSYPLCVSLAAPAPPAELSSIIGAFDQGPQRCSGEGSSGGTDAVASQEQNGRRPSKLANAVVDAIIECGVSPTAVWAQVASTVCCYECGSQISVFAC